MKFGRKEKLIICFAFAALIASAAVTAVCVKRSEKSSASSSVSNSETQTQNTSEIKTESSTSSASTENQENADVEILVNADNPIPDDWITDLIDIGNNQKADRRAYDSLIKMLDDAKAKGFNPLVCSSFRTNEKRTRLFNNKVEKYKKAGYSYDDAVKEAAKWVAFPGTSEHQTGLAFDIVSVENQNLNESQVNSACQQWLMENCCNYGFILRYPKDKTKITKIDFEPWHYRYVGRKAAEFIKNNNLCLEEYSARSN